MDQPNITTSLSNSDEFTAMISKLVPPIVEVTPAQEVAPVAEAPVSPVTPAPVEPKVVKPTEVVVPVQTAVDPDAVIDSWDGEPVAVAPVKSAETLEFETLAKELGIEAKTKEDLIKAIKARQTVGIETLPEDLAKANEIAKLGGNYLEYLKVSEVDWSKTDPVALYEDYIFNQASKSANGATVDVEKVEAYLDKIDDFEKELRGRDLQSQYINFQAQTKANLEAQARAERQNKELSTRRALDAIEDVDGFKVNPSQKEDMFAYFSTSPVAQALLKETNGNYTQALKNLFRVRYGEKMDNFRKQQIRNVTKRELLEEMQNPNITTTPSGADVRADKKDYSLQDWLTDLTKQKNF